MSPMTGSPVIANSNDIANEFRDWLIPERVKSQAFVAHTPHRRLALALLQMQEGGVALGSPDIAALVRAVLRSEALREGLSDGLILPSRVAELGSQSDW